MTDAHAATFNKDRTAIIFIEFQDEWIGPEAKLRNLLVKDNGEFNEAVANAEKIIKTARENDWLIAHAGLDLQHDPGYLIFAGGEEKIGLRKAIPNAKTWTGEGAKFIEPFTPQSGEFVVKGRSGASVFKNSTLDPFLRNNDINTVILLGFATHVCVESSLREAHDIGYNVYVVTDASGAFEKEQSDYFKKHILHHFGHNLQTTELISYISKE
mgnify:CR=1 FL=1